MAKTYAEVPRFKKIESLLREACNAHRTAIAEIDLALAKKRSESEIALLQSVRAECIKLQDHARAVVGMMFGPHT